MSVISYDYVSETPPYDGNFSYIMHYILGL